MYRYMKIRAHLFNIPYNIARERERETEERHRAEIGIYRYKTRTTTTIRHTLFFFLYI